LEKQAQTIHSLEEKVFLKDQFYKEEQKFRNYYQRNLFTLLRGIGAFEENKVFRSLGETDDDLQYQKQI
jgi:hypothetical protein